MEVNPQSPPTLPPLSPPHLVLAMPREEVPWPAASEGIVVHVPPTRGAPSI
jgi:hypothetical protein